MKPHAKKRRIRVAILAFFGMCRVNDEFKSEDLVKFCKRHLNIKYIYADTVLRYARKLRQQDMINYTCTHKETRRLKVIAPGEVHSL